MKGATVQMTMPYRKTIAVEFNHCDPAGIVFYPRYFEMTNSVIENFFREVAVSPFSEMMKRGEGVPTAQIETEFHAPSRLGDVLDWRLYLLRLGRSSIRFRLEAWCEDEHRVTAKLVLVRVGAEGKPIEWSLEQRERLTTLVETEHA